MYVQKGPAVWQSLRSLTRHIPDLPQWTPLTELPLKQLTAPPLATARTLYLPEHLPARPTATIHTLRRAA